VEAIDSLFENPVGDLKLIVQTLQKLKRLNEALHSLLPKEMAKHCQVASLTQGRLLISFDHAMWAGKFHFEKMEYLSKLRQLPEFSGLSQIEHRVNPSFSVTSQKPPSPKAAHRPLSKEAADSLDQLILYSEGKLKTSLEKFREHLRSSLTQ
jgi:hypothetical protein